MASDHGHIASPPPPSDSMQPPNPGQARHPSIASLISRLSKPFILTRNLPNFSHSFPDLVSESASPKRTRDTEDGVPDAAENARAEVEEVEWSSISTSDSPDHESFETLFFHHPNPDGRCRNGSSSGVVRPGQGDRMPRLIFFGEQHHQRQVLRAQLQSLHSLSKLCARFSSLEDRQSTHDAKETFPHDQGRPDPCNREPPQPPCEGAHRGGGRGPIYKLHLVLEHFSISDQPMLDAFSSNRLSPSRLEEAYSNFSREGFRLSHYMPLLLLARELDVPIWGGFPPREWARKAFKEGVGHVKKMEHDRVSKISRATKVVGDGDGSKLEERRERLDNGLQLPLFKSWPLITFLHPAYRSYLSWLMRPDMPPRLPEPEEAGSATDDACREVNSEVAHIYPNWLLMNRSSPQTKGFEPAQALKDSFLAHVTHWILRGGGNASASKAGGKGGGGNATSNLVGRGDEGDPNEEGEREIKNVVLVICGLGHCEYGFGSPERVSEMMLSGVGGATTSSSLAPLDGPDGEGGGGGEKGEETGSSREEKGMEPKDLFKPFIIACKPRDSGIWLSRPREVGIETGPEEEAKGGDRDQGEVVERKRYGKDLGMESECQTRSVPPPPSSHTRTMVNLEVRGKGGAARAARAEGEGCGEEEEEEKEKTELVRGLKGWLWNPWYRPLADAVVLYDWIDDEEEEHQQVDDGDDDPERPE
ncbi:hypothetical protein IE53DRAFT_386217 [Violaceomyces palustris]|uniref:Uncharacterized protein n=1 Tax=Violaceomyces palustris TaxID=1673888 RepID=A0ACD0P024_9BASI|nr:hypothetical protein IE53DRAFT_386217 [Violaceomyces palustris]